MTVNLTKYYIATAVVSLLGVSIYAGVMYVVAKAVIPYVAYAEKLIDPQRPAALTSPVDLAPITHSRRELSEIEVLGFQNEIQGKLKGAEPRIDKPSSPQFVELAREQEKQIEGLQRELLDLKTILSIRDEQIHNMRTELLVAGSQYVPGAVSDWIANSPTDVKPTDNEIRFVSDMHATFPVCLTEAEAVWIAERLNKNDWENYAPSLEEAVLEFLGRGRIMAEVPPVDLARLRLEYGEEGYFKE